MLALSTASHAFSESIPNASNVPIATTHRSIRPSTISSGSFSPAALNVSSYSSFKNESNIYWGRKAKYSVKGYKFSVMETFLMNEND